MKKSFFLLAGLVPFVLSGCGSVQSMAANLVSPEGMALTRKAFRTMHTVEEAQDLVRDVKKYREYKKQKKEQNESDNLPEEETAQVEEVTEESQDS